jgi:taurine dioxygenase
MAIEVTPLRDDLPFGARITGVDLEAVQDPEVRQELQRVFLDRGLIVFAEVEPSNRLQVEISKVFGPLKEHPVHAVDKVDPDFMPGAIQIGSDPSNADLVEIDGKPYSSWLPWHFDHCYNNELNRAGVLRAVKIVDEGGITGFTDGIALYRALPESLRERIEGREIVYTLSTQYDHLKFGRPAQYRMVVPKPVTDAFKAQAAEMPRAIHPAVWTRPTGEKVLHVSHYMAEGISGDETPEGDALLEEVCQAVNRLAADCSYHHKWRPGEMIIWDNLRMLHAVGGNRPEDERMMYRTTIKGDYGLGRFENGAAGGRILQDTEV